ncbi:MAG: NAD+ synthase [Deltaproteobacteria bacterium]|jgi:NAD+ synthetase|nr:NAD+ synthase [Deltaproteobacteria bacterium]MDL1988174.1 NAD+ synthase [Deltaproteobacteria bacterium]
MKVAIAQVNTVIGDFKYNFDKIIYFADKAKDLLCDLVVFQELVITGYPPRDLLEKKDFVDANLAWLDKLVGSIDGIGVVCGFVDKNPNDEGKPLYNAAILFEDGKILHKAYKRLLPTYDIFDERRYFEPGRSFEAFSYKGRRIGLTICEDLWNDKDFFRKRIYHIDPLSLMIEDGADLIINISSSIFHAGKRELRQKMLGAVSKKYSVPIIYANQVGGNDSFIFDGISTVFDRNGKVIARARDFKEDLVVCDLKDSEPSGDMHPVSDSETESLLKALIMGTRDYVKKCGFSKVVVGLSGGIDSALTAYIAVMALGPENVMAAFMPSQYTSPENFEDAKELAENIGIELVQIPIDNIFKEFLNLLSPSFNESDPGITEQNIQARIRGTILMALSNRHGSLLLSTGNKSEVAVGYCTLYGDMSGGLAVISDVPKTLVYGLARYINTDKEYIPKRIIEKAPSAELKPGQLDQDDLPPYEILDSILKGYIEDFKSVEELVDMGFDRKLVKDVISRVDRNEYKRHQAAPGLKVTSKAFGYGRRYPIAKKIAPYL